MSDQSIVDVTQDDREAAADWMSTQSYDWGFCGDVRAGRIEHDLPHAFARHRIAEREACAMVAEEHAAPKAVPQIDYDQACNDIAAAIRARSIDEGGE